MSDEPDHDLERQSAPAAAIAAPRAANVTRLLAALAAGSLGLDYFFAGIMDADPPAFIGAILLGMMPVQFGLLAIWAVVGPGRWLLRQLATTALAALAWLAIAVGVGVHPHAPPDFTEVSFRFTALVPLVFLAVQLPLWIARWLRGWRLVEASAAAATDQREARRFSLGDLLMMPAVVAVPLALSRWCDEFAGGVAANLMVAACLSLASGFATLPCLLSAFRSRTAGGGLLRIAGYAIGLGLAFDAAAVTMFGALPDTSAGWFVPLFILSMLMATHGSLALVRNAGYVLLPARSRRAEG
ncbi:MAG TPA: hypothetical protein VMV10_25965 [Pirellulales bacterium]|nr:hypothetical protein [Pirellulales bacterium]